MLRHLSLYLCGLLLLWGTVGCKRQQRTEVDTSVGTDLKVVVEASPVAVDTSPVSAPQRVEPELTAPVLAHGTHMVFGIRMPRGMIPVNAGENVRRFEGTHSIESVKTYILNQLAGKVNIQPNRFGGGYFISEAIPASSQRDPANADDDAKRYHIKIFDGSLGGAAVDIWEAKKGELVAEESSGHTSSALRNLVGRHQQRTSSVTPAPGPTPENRRQRERATFRVFEKMAEKKPMTEADYQSSFFTDQ
jgi:hypothetical protein